MSIEDLRNLDASGCCEPAVTPTPEEISNRPGLPAIRYRVGSFSSFRQAMIERSASIEVSDEEKLALPLRDWTTRASDDYGIALLEMWAYLADILTFYQERIANEAFLRTATLPESVRRLVALLGYEPAPGVAASTHLAFAVEKGKRVQVPEGLRVQSVPGQNERPQKFETVEAMLAWANLNEMRPRATKQQTLKTRATHAHVEGTATGLEAGDYVLLVGDDRAGNSGSERWEVRRLSAVEPDPQRNTTKISWTKGLGKPGYTEPPANPRLFALGLRAYPFGYDAPDYDILSSDLQKKFTDWSQKYLPEENDNKNHIYLDAVYDRIDVGSWIALITAKPRKDYVPSHYGSYVEVYRVEEASETVKVGYTLTSAVTRLTVDVVEQSRDDKTVKQPQNIDYFPMQGTVVLAQTEELMLAKEFAEEERSLDLDGHYPELEKGRKLILTAAPDSGIFVRFEATATDSTTVTELKLDIAEVQQARGVLSGELSPFPALASASPAVEVTVGDEGPHTATFSDVPTNLVEARSLLEAAIRRAHTTPAFTQAQVLVVGDRLLVVPGITASDEQIIEVVQVDSVMHHAGEGTAVTFVEDLPEVKPETIRLYGNAAEATHGERVAGEVLGSGDASSAFQSFSIRRAPVTFVPQPTAPRGAANTLEVRVGGVKWHEVPSLHGHGGNERVYTTSVDEEGTMRIQFGDGKTGARLPSGRNNVVATYRQGLGREGIVMPGSLKTLLDRPVGLRDATNPAGAEGGVDRENLQEARSNAPNTVRTFDRIVSLRDFEDAAREFVSVAKARATLVWEGGEQVVRLTVASQPGADIARTRAELATALDSRRDPNRKLDVTAYVPVPVQVKATVHVHPDYQTEAVLEAARLALKDEFAFDRLELGQDINLSDTYRVLQDVDGVLWVFINRLQYRDKKDRDSHGVTDQEPVLARLRIEPWELAIIRDPATDAMVNLGAGRP